MLDIRTMAVWQSVMLTASTFPFNNRAFFLTTSGSLFFGGPSSPVTAKLPLASTRSRWLPDFINPPYWTNSSRGSKVESSLLTSFQAGSGC